MPENRLRDGKLEAERGAIKVRVTKRGILVCGGSAQNSKFHLSFPLPRLLSYARGVLVQA